MNIFVLDENPIIATTYMVDRHVVKMILESSQLLCDAHHIFDTSNKSEYFFKPLKTHRNHPCAKWVRKSLSNYMWLAEHNLALCREYTYRYNKIHAVQIRGLCYWLLDNKPLIADAGLTKFVEAVGDIQKRSDPIETYRQYYNERKRHIHKWTKRSKPNWII